MKIELTRGDLINIQEAIINELVRIYQEWECSDNKETLNYYSMIYANLNQKLILLLKGGNV